MREVVRLRKGALCSALFTLALLSGCGRGAEAAIANTPTLDAAQTAAAPAAEVPDVVWELAESEETPVPTALAAPTPTPSPTPGSGPVAEAFTLVWTSDTQHYSELHPEYLTAMTQWAVTNKAAYNVKAFIHTGDMVNRAASTRQWGNIDAALDILAGELPFLALAGNHDVGTETIDYSYFLKHVASRYPDASDFYQKGRGAYVELPMDDQSFLLIGTSWGYKDAAVDWLNKVIAKYPNHIVVLAAHSYLNTNGSLTDGGDILFERVVKKNPNVRIVLSGHRDDIAFRTDSIDDNRDGLPDRTVYTQLYNYQEVKQAGGGGYMRILTIDPGKRTMDVKTYSPYFDEWKTGEKEQLTISNLF